MCLQETHCEPKDIETLAVPGYQLKHFNRSKSSNNRYFGGLLLLYKTCLKKGIKIIDNKHQDKLWIKLDKTFFKLPNDLFICFVYISPATSQYLKKLPLDMICLMS